MWIAAAILIALSGCASQTGTTNTPATKTSATSVRSTPGAPALPPVLSRTDAWGNVQITRLPTTLPDTRTFQFEDATTPDGMLVGMESPLNANNPDDLALMNATTGQVTPLRSLAAPYPYSVHSASADADWIAWWEGALSADSIWVMNVYNRQTGETRTLAQTKYPNTTDLTMSIVSGPFVSNGRVMWGQPSKPQTAGAAMYTVYMADLSTGAITTLATDAEAEGLAWPWAAWESASACSDPAAVLMLRNLSTGEAHSLLAPCGGVALSGTSLAYDESASSTGPGTPYLFDDLRQIQAPTDKGMQIHFAMPATGVRSSVWIGARAVVWEQQDQVEVYDRVQRRVVIVADSTGGQVFAGGDLVVWSEPVTGTGTSQDPVVAGPLDVLNTLSLPAKPIHDSAG